MENCIFCKIVKHEIPGKIIYEDDICLVFLDLSQTTDGHTLVIPKTHYKNFLEVEEDTLVHMIKVTQKIANLLVEKLNANGVNILTNANEISGQTVMHFHIHIIPRYNQDDKIKINFTDRSSNIDLNNILNKIKTDSSY